MREIAGRQAESAPLAIAPARSGLGLGSVERTAAGVMDWDRAQLGVDDKAAGTAYTRALAPANSAV